MLLLFSPKAKFMEKNRFQKLSKIVKFEVLDKNAQIRIIFEFKAPKAESRSNPA